MLVAHWCYWVAAVLNLPLIARRLGSGGESPDAHEGARPRVSHWDTWPVDVTPQENDARPASPKLKPHRSPTPER